MNFPGFSDFSDQVAKLVTVKSGVLCNREINHALSKCDIELTGLRRYIGVCENESRSCGEANDLELSCLFLFETCP